MNDPHDKNDLTQGVIWKKLLGFFFPILFGMLFQQLYNTVDAIIVGKFVGTDALAAVGGSAAVISNLVIGFFVGLASGATVVISQYFGARDYARLSDAVHTVVALCLIIGAALTAAGYFLTPWALELIKNPADIAYESTLYLRIYFAGSVPLLLFNVGSGILRAVGDSRRPLYYLVVCCILNIFLDLLFVVRLGMGVSGAAWATVISVAVSAVLVLVCLVRSDGPQRLNPRCIRIDLRSLRRILYLGIPAGVQSAMYSLSNLIIQAAVNGLGVTVVAAWTATEKFDGLYWVTINSFGVAICAFVGQCYGAGLHERSRKGIKSCLLIALGVSAGMSALLLGLSRIGLRIISDDPAVIDYSVEMLSYFVPYYVIWAFIEVISNALRGMGDAIMPMVISIVGICGLRILWVIFVIPWWHSIFALSVIYPISWALTAFVFIIYYRMHMKKAVAA